MKNLFKSIKYWLEFGKYKQLIGIVIGIISFFIMFEKDIDLWICIILSLIITIISIIIIHRFLINEYADDYIEQTEKDRYIPKENILGKNKNIDDIIKLDNELVEFLDKYSSGKKSDYSEKELNKQWKIHGHEFTNRADEILRKMDNVELLVAMASTEEITHIVDIFKYFKCYKIDVDYLIEHPDKAYEYYLDNIEQQEAIANSSINYYVYNRLMELNYFDEIEEFILSQMSNDELMKLADASKDWNEKLHFYGFIDKNKKK